jgi:hypothetical protein
MRSNINDVCEFENGVLKSIDFSKLYFLDLDRPTDEIQLVRGQPKPTDLAGLPKLTMWPTAPASPLTLTKGQPGGIVPARLLSPRPFPKRKAAPLPKVKPLPRTKYSVQRSPDSSFLGGLLGGTLKGRGRIEVELPLGAPRFVSVATLKAMLGADDDEILFRKVGKRWEPCSDSFEVDLKNRARVFRLGQVQIYS